MRKFIGMLIVSALLSVGQVASAGPYEDGFAAYKQRDYATALRLWRPLAEQGNASAQNNLGNMYRDGQGIARNYKESVKWFRRAAEQQHARAQNNLGVMFAAGQGIAQDYIRAHMWFNLAAASLSGEDGKNATDGRNTLAARMTSAQIAQAQEMARKCQQSKFKDCGW